MGGVQPGSVLCELRSEIKANKKIRELWWNSLTRHRQTLKHLVILT